MQGQLCCKGDFDGDSLGLKFFLLCEFFSFLNPIMADYINFQNVFMHEIYQIDFFFPNCKYLYIIRSGPLTEKF